MICISSDLVSSLYSVVTKFLFIIMFYFYSEEKESLPSAFSTQSLHTGYEHNLAFALPMSRLSPAPASRSS